MSGEAGPASRETILCAVDFSGDSAAALGWACRQAALTDARLVLLHVVHDPASSPGFYRRVGSEWLEPMVAVAEDMMAEFLAAFRAGAEHLPALETRLVRGLPPGRIVEVARELGADLVVVGSRGRTGLPHILLGSVAERVVQTAPVPVTVVKRRDAAPE
ncbi:MAG TPA: universal stress protein [Amaricoccus sp.]|uniref:universal stress protein n=1 Tax=Amaricoccus sp. TaxID=1872485 RepID=UPI002C4FDE07|nr:universal stress protein [Amaricoccus sp.]HPG23440.1 universal stress protein [Amaricoccus sp.]HRW14146.1 universal stress protein [Amaricoccus sp.]